MQHCRICDSTSLTHFQRGSVQLSRCQDCDSVQVINLPDERDLLEYYANDYELVEQTNKELKKSEIRRWSRLPEQLSLMHEIMNIISPPAVIADIGCDRGYFLDEARRYGYSVFGVEPSNHAQKYTQAINIPVFSSLQESSLRPDIVVMWHSLEHTTNPLITLREIHSKLTDEGIVAIRVPDFGSLWSRLLQHRWVWFQPQNHNFHFSHASLDFLLRKAGFQPYFVRSQRPNSFITMRSTYIAQKAFTEYAQTSITIKDYLSPWYQFLTGIELFAIAKKIQ